MRPLLLALPLAALLALSPAAAQAPAGRLAEATGAVSLRPTGGTWSAAPRGTALLEGQALRTGPRAQAELDLGANRLGLDPDTVLRIDSAHPAAPAFMLEQGRAMILLRSLRPGQVARVHLARGSITLAEPGLYVVTAPDGARPGSVGVSRGLAQVYGPGVSLAVPAGQTGLFGGAEPAGLRAGVAEGFLADDPSAPPPQVVSPAPQAAPAAPPPDLASLPGADPLRHEGSWAELPDYGRVWYPPVVPSWNPYADPWLADRWGHVPWTSGAWVMIGPRWAWMPPYRVPPPAWRHAHPPPGVAQPHRPPHLHVRPPPPTVAPPPVAAPNPFPAAPHVVAPRPSPPPAMLPPPAAAPVALPTPAPGMPRPPLATPMPPPIAAPPIAAPPVMAPPVMAPRPAALPPPVAAPMPSPAAPPAMAAPRPSLPAALPPPMAAPSPAPAAPHVFAPRPAPPPAALPPPPMAAPRMAPPVMAPPPMAAPMPRPAPPPPAAPRTCPPGRTTC